MPSSIRPGINKHGGKIATGIGGVLAALTIYLLSQANQEEPRYRGTGRAGVQVTQNAADNARQDIQIEHLQAAVMEIKQTTRDMAQSNKEAIKAVNKLNTSVGVLNARLEFNRNRRAMSTLESAAGP